jgi:ribosomal protein S18 acetylase RimI-like enzyme
MINYRHAQLEDLAGVVGVHLQAFPGFFLSMLGEGFLYEMYKGFLEHPDGVFWVATNDSNTVAGFAVGTIAPETMFSDLRQKRAVFFLWHALPALLKRPQIVFPRIFNALFYKGDKPANLLGGALLSSIGVKPGVVGKAVGYNLLTHFESEVKGRQKDFIYLTTDAINNDLVNHFYQRNGYQVESRFTQGKSRTMFRYLKKLK